MHFSLFSVIYVPMEDKDVVLKQFIIKLKLIEEPKTSRRITYLSDIFDRCHIRKRHNDPLFPYLHKSTGQI